MDQAFSTTAFTWILPALLFLFLALVPWAIAKIRGANFFPSLILVWCVAPLFLAKFIPFVFPAWSNGFVLIGLSFFCFRQISFFVDLWRSGRELPSTANYFAYLFFPPTFFLGPLQRFSQFEKQRLQLSWINLREGAWLVFLGLAYKFLVADTLRPLCDAFFSAQAPATLTYSYAALLAFSIQFYCDFVGYTFLARGLAKIVGFEVPENFFRPYLAKNPQDFWHRWQRTLGEWFRDYVYLPLFFRTKWVELSIFCSFLLMGLWHGLENNFIALGIYWGAVMAVFAWAQPLRIRLWRGLGPASPFLGWLATIHCVLFAFFLLRDNGLKALSQLRWDFSFPPALWLLGMKVAFPLLLVIPIERWGKEKGWLRLALIAWISYYAFLVFFFSEASAARDLKFLYFQF